MKKIILKIERIFFYFRYHLLERLRLILDIDQKFYIGKYKLILPPKHLFTYFKTRYVNYDKYLNKVVNKIEHNQTVIDIGANVGDSLLQIINKNKYLNYYCIEGDNFFFEYLKKNVENLQPKIKKKNYNN